MDSGGRLRQQRLLLVDDDEWVRDALCLYFEVAGCSIEAFETAEQALEALKQHDFDIVIAEHRLPGMNGVEFLKQAKQSRCHPICLLISAYSTESIVAEALDLGIDDFIAKPFSSEAVEGSIAGLITNRGHV